MFKLKSSAIALLAVVAMGAPAFAGSLTAGSSDEFDSSRVLLQLQSSGIHATEVSDAGGQIKATVRLDDGTLVTRYFWDDLRPVATSAGDDTRVLSHVYAGADSATPGNYSLTHDEAEY